MATGRRTLEMQADTIDAVLARHRVHGKVKGGTVTPRYVQFHVTTEMGTKVKQVASLSEEIALALGKREARVYRRGSAINVEVPRTKSAPVRLIGLFITEVPFAKYPSGVTRGFQDLRQGDGIQGQAFALPHPCARPLCGPAQLRQGRIVKGRDLRAGRARYHAFGHGGDFDDTAFGLVEDHRLFRQFAQARHQRNILDRLHESDARRVFGARGYRRAPQHRA